MAAVRSCDMANAQQALCSQAGRLPPATWKTRVWKTTKERKHRDLWNDRKLLQPVYCTFYTSGAAVKKTKQNGCFQGCHPQCFIFNQSPLFLWRNWFDLEPFVHPARVSPPLSICRQSQRKYESLTLQSCQDETGMWTASSKKTS